MGAQQSKDESLYQQVNYGNIEGIKALRQEGAGLEWIDKEGKTPLILACMRPDLLAVAKVLIELGANVNAYRAGSHAGTPLHHAAKRGLDQTVNLLLSHGANPFIMNDDCQTPLGLARAKGHCNVVRAIESRTCLFSGWLREVYGPSILEVFAPQWVSRKVWAVVLPCDSRNPTNPSKFELAIYPDLQVAQPRVVIALWKAHIEDPKFNQPDPALVIVDKATRKNHLSCGLRCQAGSSHLRKTHVHHLLEDQRPHTHCSRRRFRGLESTSISAMLNVSRQETRYKFLSAYEGDKQQIQWFYNACRGIFQQNSYIPVAPVGATPIANHPYLNVHAPTTSAATPAAPEDEQLTMAINASIQTAIAEGVPVTGTTNTTGWETSSESTSHNGGRLAGGAPTPKVEPSVDPYNGWSGIRPSSSMPQLHTSQLETVTVSPSAQEAPPSVSVPSAPPIVPETFYDGPVHYPSIDSSPVDLSVPAAESKPGPSETKEGSDSNSSGSCVICLDAPVEGACIPCGHMAGCMSCLNEIKGKKWGCPVCRAEIDQVVRLYAV
ncbi:putative RING zinc finger and ankyrin repeat containing protein [Iris pallida]|uniref:RING zinc finger and ankyrin repeat containing protein n=1 Tax=Iris pallida TaxID=29817 RepID=A0AAX6FTM9_IRIPA|nr:putative RING zinc finger and ankyrin repeat containing protein [Iris pallida]